MEGLCLPLGRGRQGSQLRRLRLCLLASAGCCWGLQQLRGAGPLHSSQHHTTAADRCCKIHSETVFDYEMHLLELLLLQAQKTYLKQPPQKVREKHRKKNQSRSSSLSRSYEGREKALPGCLNFKELDNRLLPPPALWFWFWPHRQVLKRLTVLGTDGYGIQ